MITLTSFFPWSYLDSVNKIQLVVWFAQFVIGAGIWAWAVVLDKPFMVSKENHADPETPGGPK